MIEVEVKNFIKSAKKIAIEAGEEIMKVYNGDDFDIEKKGDDSPLTKADLAANKIICDALKVLSPDIPIISEENKVMPYSERKNFAYCWMVDPLDGTKEFIKRNGEFTVNIALIHQTESILGVVYVPVTKQLYWASKSNGAFLQENDKLQRLQSCMFRHDEKYLNIVCSRSHLNEETSTFISKYDMPEKVSKGSSLKFLILASGNAHIYPRMAPTMEWDTAAAHIILEEAGGSIINNETQKPLRYNKENLLNPHFIAFGNQIS